MFNVIIHNKEKDTYMAPAVYDGATLEWTISGMPGRLFFTVHADAGLQFQEGDTVQVEVGGTPLFFGYVFVKSQTKDSSIEVIAYDQLRYLKNKESYTYKGKKASEVITDLANTFQLHVGEIADTEFVIDKKRKTM